MNIKYKNYLLSDEWRKFRKEVLSTRTKCQNCGCSVKNTIPNIHHINYKNIFKETLEDVLVLCQDCHLRLHNKPKWKKAKFTKQDMNFTKASEQSSKKKYFNIKSKETRQCIGCAEHHPIFYKKYPKDIIRLAMVCQKSKPRTKFIKMEENLVIPII